MRMKGVQIDDCRSLPAISPSVLSRQQLHERTDPRPVGNSCEAQRIVPYALRFFHLLVGRCKKCPWPRVPP
eukprot:3785729-Pyramimonas_sp.AAC.1